MANINDVAAYIIDSLGAPGTDPMKLQKLAYFAQGWSLALANQKLFDDDFEARPHGPVAPALLIEPEPEGLLKEWPAGNKGGLTPVEKAVVDAVVRSYGGLGGWQLLQKTHEPDTPWSQVRHNEGLEPDDPCNVVILKEDIQKYFRAKLIPVREDSGLPEAA